MTPLLCSSHTTVHASYSTHRLCPCPRASTTKWSDIYLIHKSERNIRIRVINHFCSFRWMKLRPKNETIFKCKDKFHHSNTCITLLVWGWLVLKRITQPRQHRHSNLLLPSRMHKTNDTCLLLTSTAYPAANN